MNIVYFLICLCSSTIGAISGIGGGVIIKPIMDVLGTMSVSAISFLSGCTVLTMSVVSLLGNMKSEVKLHKNTSSFLALGACLGGVVGKSLFTYIKTLIENDPIVGAIQSMLMFLTSVGIYLYIRNKEKIKTKHVTNPIAGFGIGLSLGLISSFLGIGGGPINIGVLYYFFSMTSKEAALNSLFIIMLSQLTSLISTVVSATVPNFSPLTLLFMCVGGVAGAAIGSTLSKRFSDQFVEKAFITITLWIIGINIFNFIKFTIL